MLSSGSHQPPKHIPMTHHRIQKNPNRPNFFQRIWHARTDFLLGLLFLLITVLYAIFMLTDRVPLLGWLLLAGLWLAYAFTSGRLSFPTPLDLPILALVILLPISYAISTDPASSQTKITGLLLGIALFYLIVNAVRDFQTLRLVIIALIILAIGTATLGFVGMDAADGFLETLPEALTQPLDAVRAAIGEGGVHVNTVGGAMAFFLPLLVSLLWDGGAYYRKYLKRKRFSQAHKLLYVLLLLLALLLVALALWQTSSRGAYLGCAVGLIALAIWKDRRFLWLLPVIVIALMAFFFINADGDFSKLIAILDAGEDQTLAGRLNAWRHSLILIQDFPLTGTGIGTYSAVFEDRYLFEIFPYRTTAYLHTHNTFLSVAVDLGLPGLVAYVGMLTGCGVMIWRTRKLGRSILRVLIKGLACGLLAHQIFGLADAFVLGTKLGAIQWIFLGLVAAVFTHQDAFRGKHDADAITKPDWGRLKAQGRDISIGLGWWLLISLAALTFIILSPLVSVFTSIIGGVLLGLLLTKSYRKVRTRT